MKPPECIDTKMQANRDTALLVRKSIGKFSVRHLRYLDIYDTELPLTIYSGV